MQKKIRLPANKVNMVHTVLVLSILTAEKLNRTSVAALGPTDTYNLSTGVCGRSVNIGNGV